MGNKSHIKWVFRLRLNTQTYYLYLKVCGLLKALVCVSSESPFDCEMGKECISWLTGVYGMHRAHPRKKDSVLETQESVARGRP